MKLNIFSYQANYEISVDLWTNFTNLINSTLNSSYRERPSCKQVLEKFNQWSINEDSISNEDIIYLKGKADISPNSFMNNYFNFRQSLNNRKESKKFLMNIPKLSGEYMNFLPY